MLNKVNKINIYLGIVALISVTALIVITYTIPLGKKEVIVEDPYPEPSEQTMSNRLTVDCYGDGVVTLWNEPTFNEGSISDTKVTCGATALAFNEYYNKKWDMTFYRVRVINVGSGWIGESLINWE